MVTNFLTIPPEVIARAKLISERIRSDRERSGHSGNRQPGHEDLHTEELNLDDPGLDSSPMFDVVPASVSAEEFEW